MPEGGGSPGNAHYSSGVASGTVRRGSVDDTAAAKDVDMLVAAIRTHCPVGNDPIRIRLSQIRGSVCRPNRPPAFVQECSGVRCVLQSGRHG
jgi:hypothetical protein